MTFFNSKFSIAATVIVVPWLSAQKHGNIKIFPATGSKRFIGNVQVKIDTILLANIVKLSINTFSYFYCSSLASLCH